MPVGKLATFMMNSRQHGKFVLMTLLMVAGIFAMTVTFFWGVCIKNFVG